MATTSRNGGGDKAAATDITISAAVVVSTLREESERLQCLAAAQMAIRESCAERLQACPELRDDVRIADARKGAYEAAALRLQGIVEAVLRGGNEATRAAPACTPTPPRHPLVAAALSTLSPHKRYDALAQLALTKENVPVDGETMTALRQAYRDVCELLPGVADVGEVEALRGMPELLTWMSAASSKIPEDAAFQTQALLAAIDASAFPQHQQAIVEAAVTEIRRLGNDAAIRVMLGLV
jgi:hypothetical protein